MKKSEILMLSAITFSAGVILGFLLSPVKHGIINIAGNTTHNHPDKKMQENSESKNTEDV